MDRDGLGSVVRVTAGGSTYTKVMDGQSGYLSQSLAPLYFGLGKADRIEGIEVSSPSGKTQTVRPPFTLGSRIDVREPYRSVADGRDRIDPRRTSAFPPYAERICHTVDVVEPDA